MRFMWGQPPSAVRGAKLRRRSSADDGTRKWIHVYLLPQPRIIVPVSNQSSSNGILQEVLNFGIEVLRTSEHMVERLGLPDSPLSIESLVNLVGRSSIDGVHDLRQRTYFHCLVINQRHKDQVNMIGHDDGSFKIELLPNVIEAAFQND
jgi:hypothetical protein